MAESKDKKVMDVAKPGKSAPDATSRPIIVGHKSMVEDPTIKKDSLMPKAGEDDKPSTDPTTDIATMTKGEMVISPPSEADEKSETATDTNKAADENVKTDDKAAEPDTSDKDSAAEEKKAEGANSEEHKTDADTNATSTNDAIVEAVADQVNKGKQKKDAKPATDEHIEKLIADKKYFVKVAQVTHRRNNRRMLIILLLVIVLALVTLNFLVDAGVIKTSIKPLTNVIKN